MAAFETIYPNLSDETGLLRYATRGREDGFSGMFAVHPRQVETINAAFIPTAVEVAQARRIVEAFAASGGSGALRIDGKMVDAPHLANARKILALAARSQPLVPLGG